MCGALYKVRLEVDIFTRHFHPSSADRSTAHFTVHTRPTLERAAVGSYWTQRSHPVTILTTP